MPLPSKILQLARKEASADLARLRREHVDELREIARDPSRHGPHPSSHTHGQAIFDEICKTYRRRAEAIHDALMRAIRSQDSEPFTVDDLATAFNDLFEPERRDALDYSRMRLTTIGDGSFINDSSLVANRLLAWFRTRAEQVVADHERRIRRSRAADRPPQAIAASDPIFTPGVTRTARHHADFRAEEDRAAEMSRQIERLGEVLPTLTDGELSAYADSRTIRIFLLAKGHSFTALTVEQVAERFRGELARRKTLRRERLRSTFTSPRTLIAIVVVIIVIVTLLVTCSAGARFSPA